MSSKAGVHVLRVSRVCNGEGSAYSCQCDNTKASLTELPAARHAAKYQGLTLVVCFKLVYYKTMAAQI